MDLLEGRIRTYSILSRDGLSFVRDSRVRVDRLLAILLAHLETSRIPPAPQQQLGHAASHSDPDQALHPSCSLEWPVLSRCLTSAQQARTSLAASQDFKKPWTARTGRTCSKWPSAGPARGVGVQPMQPRSRFPSRTSSRGTDLKLPVTAMPDIWPNRVLVNQTSLSSLMISSSCIPLTRSAPSSFVHGLLL